MLVLRSDRATAGKSPVAEQCPVQVKARAGTLAWPGRASVMLLVVAGEGVAARAGPVLLAVQVPRFAPGIGSALHAVLTSLLPGRPVSNVAYQKVVIMIVGLAV